MRDFFSGARHAANALVAAWLLALACMAPAHEIPNDVKVQAFVKPDGQRLQLLVRVPLTAMREVDIPKRGPGYLDLARADAALRNAANLWIADNVDLYEGETRLVYPRVVEARVSLPSDKSFASFAEARAHVAGPRLPEKLEMFWNQGLLDVLFEYPIQSEGAAFSIHPRLERLGLRVAISLRFLPPGGAERAYEFHGDPGRVALDPRWHQAALRRVGFPAHTRRRRSPAVSALPRHSVPALRFAGADRPHRLALDARARGTPEPVPVAGIRRRHAGERDALVDGGAAARGRSLVREYGVGQTSGGQGQA